MNPLSGIFRGKRLFANGGFMRLICILALLAAIMAGAVIFGFRRGANLWVHMVFLASVVVFLTSIVVLIGRGASWQLDAHEEFPEIRDPDHATPPPATTTIEPSRGPADD